jgi:hypothetical protein
MTPSGPSFVTASRDSFYFDPAFVSTWQTSLRGALGEFRERIVVFDAKGKKWSASEIRMSRKKNWWSVLLANTINPNVATTILWKDPTPYSIEELKQAFSHAVDQDDDILTQFVEADDLKKKISQAQSFEELVSVHEWMVTDHTDEPEA